MLMVQEVVDEAEGRRRERLIRRIAPRVLPVGWMRERLSEFCWRYVGPKHCVMLGVEVHDGSDWLHLSMSEHIYGAPSLPTWADLSWAKDTFIGRDRQAVQVLPPRDEHYSVAEVLHIYSPIGVARVVPDFRIAGAL